VVVPQAGFVMNNEMDDFSSKPGVPNKFGVTGGKENAIAAGKRPLSSMSPTIVKKGGKAVLGLGSPSGSQIITCVVLTMLNYLEYGMPLFQAVASLRYHHQWLPDEIQVEEPGFSTETDTQLMKMGYRIKRGGIGCKVQAIALEKEGLHGVSDPRGEGLAAGKTPPHPSK
jgi:gamma-glutamyltranspeptidase/glutathione hydrolase